MITSMWTSSWKKLGYLFLHKKNIFRDLRYLPLGPITANNSPGLTFPLTFRRISRSPIFTPRLLKERKTGIFSSTSSIIFVALSILMRWFPSQALVLVLVAMKNRSIICTVPNRRSCHHHEVYLSFHWLPYLYWPIKSWTPNPSLRNRREKDIPGTFMWWCNFAKR